jgi:hypothetical protein
LIQSSGERRGIKDRVVIPVSSGEPASSQRTHAIVTILLCIGKPFMLRPMSEDDLTNLRNDVDRHEEAVIEASKQMALLKAENREFKEIIVELIDAVEYLAQAKRNLPNEEAALERFQSTMAGLQERFKD